MTCLILLGFSHFGLNLLYLLHQSHGYYDVLWQLRYSDCFSTNSGVADSQVKYIASTGTPPTWSSWQRKKLTAHKLL
jgi:hypothetical protein